MRHGSFVHYVLSMLIMSFILISGTGRCIVCENNSSRIVHPTCEYFMDNTNCNFPVYDHSSADHGGMLDFDFIYFDSQRDKDAEFAKITSGQSLPF